MPQVQPTMHLLIEQTRSDLLGWLRDCALPLWSTAGTDWQAGGFFEKIGTDGRPLEEHRRTRVVARQTYVFAVAAKLGWPGPQARLVAHGLSFLQGRLRQPDGLYASAVLPDGTVVNPVFDLYEQAFGLFALASVQAHAADARPWPLADAALRTLDALRLGYKHPELGFEEGLPPREPLRANPHMHLLEAAMACADLGGTHAATWNALADELATLALTRFVCPDTGAVAELFDRQWRPLTPRLIEPGHQFEWAWLLMRWGRQRHRPDAIAAARRMVHLAESHGVCAQRGVAINALNERLEPTDTQARLWPQTERVKAWCQCAELADTPLDLDAALAGVERAAAGLRRYLAHPNPGLWHEVMHADGSFERAATRASSLYHIVCCIETLHATVAKLSYKPGTLTG